MANSTEHFNVNFPSKASKNLSIVGPTGGSFPAFTDLQIDSPNGADSYFPNSKECKRKWTVINGPVDLQLGCSSSSCVTVFSGKETEEESSINLSLSIDHSRIDQALHPNKRAERPKVDLELSLSAGPTESGVTRVTQGPLRLVDEGSTSSRRNSRPLLRPLRSVEMTNHLHYVFGHMNYSSPVIPTFSASCDSGLALRHNSNVKTCQFTGCTRGARGASGLCITHGGGRRCQRAGCQKGAEGKTVFCKAHGGGRRCEHLGCTKSAEGCTDFCIAHGGGRRCSNEGCTRAARGKSGLCIRHGGGKRCKIGNCTKSAEGISGLCISHGGGRRCQYSDCTKGAQGSTMFCKAHGGGKRCTFLGCTKGAEGSSSLCKGHGGGKRCTFEGGCSKSVHGDTLFCVNHGGGKRCAESDCTKSARGRTSFCVRHGGGKRCKHEGCGKSAQGSTDFCKAHGGGKRCSWGQWEFGGKAFTPCDKFARGKAGLCTAHSALVLDKQISDPTSDPGLQDPLPCKSISMQILPRVSCSVKNTNLGQFSLPEGRVHGGSLMAMLRGSNSNQIPGAPSNPVRSHPVPPHSWV